MAITNVQALADIIKPTPFSQYTTMNTRELSAFIQSGILTPSPVLDAFLANPTGGSTLNRPTWGDLADDTPRTSDTSGYPLYDSTAANNNFTSVLPGKVTAFAEIAVRLNRNYSWSSQSLLGQLAGQDPFARIGDRVAAYWARTLQKATLAALAGVFANDDTADGTGTDTHKQGDLTFDVSTLNGGVFQNGVTNFTAEAFFDALQTAGDAQGMFTTICMHSVVKNRARKNNLIDTMQDSVTGATLDTFQGLRVITDDGMPKNGNVYDSYIFGPGAIEFSNVYSGESPETEVVRRAEAGLGAGANELWNRVQWCIHPRGHAYIGSGFPDGGPKDTTGTAPLNAAASWERRAPERKQIMLARLRTREA